LFINSSGLASAVTLLVPQIGATEYYRVKQFHCTCGNIELCAGIMRFVRADQGPKSRRLLRRIGGVPQIRGSRQFQLRVRGAQP
jgi:hypothetical protein